MCGIVGCIDPAGIDARLLARQRDTLAHRGPDDAGLWISEDRSVALAHRRLAIIDLSSAGRQPMERADGALRIVFNGELHNFCELKRDLEARGRRFRTRTDTEVVLAAYEEWGRECLDRLNGMFAFAIWDERDRRLLLARDRAGEKPLFYRRSGRALAFASELKALLADPACPRQLDARALDAYLTYGYVPHDQCILAGIRKLPQAHAMEFRVGQDLRIWRYWNLPEADDPGAADATALANELEGLLEDAVRLRLEADVPVGVLLSGGVDSSVVTALAARARPRLTTFNVSLPDHPTFDEAPYARAVAAHLGTEHVELVAEPPDAELLHRLARQFDEPIGDHSIIPSFLVCSLIRDYATVALGGDGGDELFGGYPHYTFVPALDRLRRLVPRPMRALAARSAERLVPVGTRGRNHLIGFDAELGRSLAHVNVYFDARARRRLLAPALVAELAGSMAPEAWKSSLCQRGATPLRAATRLDFETTMVDDYLVKVDRASMLASLEIRAPFLDHRVIEFAFRLPDSLRAHGGMRKILLRRVAERLLPADSDLQRKQGFSLPLAEWFRGRWGGLVRGVLAEADPALFSPRALAALLSAQERGFANANRLFALMMLELWRREYAIAIPSTEPCRN